MSADDLVAGYGAPPAASGGSATPAATAPVATAAPTHAPLVAGYSAGGGISDLVSGYKPPESGFARAAGALQTVGNALDVPFEAMDALHRGDHPYDNNFAELKKLGHKIVDPVRARGISGIPSGLQAAQDEYGMTAIPQLKDEAAHGNFLSQQALKHPRAVGIPLAIGSELLNPANDLLNPVLGVAGKVLKAGYKAIPGSEALSRSAAQDFDKFAPVRTHGAGAEGETAARNLLDTDALASGEANKRIRAIFGTDMTKGEVDEVVRRHENLDPRHGELNPPRAVPGGRLSDAELDARAAKLYNALGQLDAEQIRSGAAKREDLILSRPHTPRYAPGTYADPNHIPNEVDDYLEDRPGGGGGSGGKFSDGTANGAKRKVHMTHDEAEAGGRLSPEHDYRNSLLLHFRKKLNNIERVQAGERLAKTPLVEQQQFTGISRLRDPQTGVVTPTVTPLGAGIAAQPAIKAFANREARNRARFETMQKQGLTQVPRAINAAGNLARGAEAKRALRQANVAANQATRAVTDTSDRADGLLNYRTQQARNAAQGAMNRAHTEFGKRLGAVRPKAADVARTAQGEHDMLTGVQKPFRDVLRPGSLQPRLVWSSKAGRAVAQYDPDIPRRFYVSPKNDTRIASMVPGSAIEGNADDLAAEISERSGQHVSDQDALDFLRHNAAKPKREIFIPEAKRRVRESAVADREAMRADMKATSDSDIASGFARVEKRTPEDVARITAPSKRIAAAAYGAETRAFDRFQKMISRTAADDVNKKKFALYQEEFKQLFVGYRKSITDDIYRRAAKESHARGFVPAGPQGELARGLNLKSELGPKYAHAAIRPEFEAFLRSENVPSEEAKGIGAFVDTMNKLTRLGVISNPAVHVIWNLTNQHLGAGGDVRDFARVLNPRWHPDPVLAEAAARDGALPSFGASTKGMYGADYAKLLTRNDQLTRAEQFDKFSTNVWDKNQAFVFENIERKLAIQLYAKFVHDGLPGAEAGIKVRKALGDYANVSRQGLEKHFTQAAFFYPWLKTIVPFWAHTLAQAPERLTAPMAGVSANNRLEGDPNAATEKPYTIFLGLDDKGNPRYFSAPLPQRIMEDVLSLVAPRGDIAGNVSDRAAAGERIIDSHLNPAIGLVSDAIQTQAAPATEPGGAAMHTLYDKAAPAHVQMGQFAKAAADRLVPLPLQVKQFADFALSLHSLPDVTRTAIDGTVSGVLGGSAYSRGSKRTESITRMLLERYVKLAGRLKAAGRDDLIGRAYEQYTAALDRIEKGS